MNSALQQLADRVSQAMSGVGNNLGALASALQQVASLPSAPTPTPAQDGPNASNYVDTLRQQVLNQTAYTPQAKAYLQDVPINTWTNPSIPTWGGVYNGENVAINPHFVNPNNQQYSLDTLRHEFIHALDAQANGEYIPASFPRENNATLNSYGMYDKMTPQQQKFFTGPNGYGFDRGSIPQNNRTRDTEGLAFWGQNGQNVLLNPTLAPFYKDAYIPATPVGSFHN